MNLLIIHLSTKDFENGIFTNMFDNFTQNLFPYITIEKSLKLIFYYETKYMICCLDKTD